MTVKTIMVIPKLLLRVLEQGYTMSLVLQTAPLQKEERSITHTAIDELSPRNTTLYSLVRLNRISSALVIYLLLHGSGYSL